MTILGAGTPIRATETGKILGLQVEVLVGSVYQDPGVKVQDATDGDLSRSVAVCGISKLQGVLVNPTLPGRPHVITYTATDKSGNVASMEFRWAFLGFLHCLHVYST